MRLRLAGATLLAIALSTIVNSAPAESAEGPATQAVGIRVSGGRLVEANGTELVLRGINHAHTWYQTQTNAFADIKATGANSVRVVLASGQRWTANPVSDVAAVINRCKQNRLICVLEVHDTTGYGEQSGAATLAQAVDYWISVRTALAGQENYVILNIGNEPHGNSGYQAWTTDTANAIRRLRAAGFEHTIMVDAPNWGQDWTNTMRDNAPTVAAADASGNTVFSIHMYGVYDTAAEVQAYLSSFLTRGLPIVVGEFGHNHSDGNPDEDAIMAYAQANRIGYMGWSWSGNGGGVEYLDMVVGFNPANRTPWGTRFIAGPNGIAATSREATIFGGGGGGDTQAPTAPGTPTASGVTATAASLTWSASTDNVGVVAYDVVRVQGATETAVTSSTTNSAALTGLTPATVYTLAVYARDAAGNRSPRSGTVTVTTPTGGGGGGGCTATYTITNSWPGGFQAAVTVTNGATAGTGWTVSWTFANGQVISQVWNGSDTASGASHSVRNMPYNGNLGPGGTATFGFLASWNGTNAVPTLTCTRS